MILTDQEILTAITPLYQNETVARMALDVSIDDYRAIEQAVIAKLAQGVSVEPVAWMRPSVTENGIVYDSSFRDENGMVLPETREEQGFERLYTAEALAAARVAALEEAAKVCDRQAIPNAGFLAEKVRALINTNLTTGEMK